MCNTKKLLCKTGKCIIKNQQVDGSILAPRRFTVDCQHNHRLGQANHG